MISAIFRVISASGSVAKAAAFEVHGKLRFVVVGEQQCLTGAASGPGGSVPGEGGLTEAGDAGVEREQAAGQRLIGEVAAESDR